MEDSKEYPLLPDTLEKYYQEIVKTALVKNIDLCFVNSQSGKKNCLIFCI